MIFYFIASNGSSELIGLPSRNQPPFNELEGAKNRRLELQIYKSLILIIGS
jgi:hypothetical protein